MTAREIEFNDGRAPVASPNMTMSEVLQKAHAMAMQIEKLLMNPACSIPSADTFRVRLARAHALSLLDQLSELVSRRQPEDGPRLARARVAEDEETSLSGVHPSLRQA